MNQSTIAAEKLIVEHIQMIEDTKSVLTDLDNKLITQIHKTITSWTEAEGYYLSDNSTKEDDVFSNLWLFFCDELLCVSQETNNNIEKKLTFLCTCWDWNEFIYDKSSHITGLLGLNEGRYGFSFYISNDFFKSSANRKKICSEFTAANPELKEMGFIFDLDQNKQQYWFLPFVLDKDTILACIEAEDFEDAMEPVISALNKVKAANDKFFVKLVEQLKNTPDILKTL